MNPRGCDQLATMVSVDRLTCPPHSIRGGQPGQQITVAHDQFHQDILPHRGYPESMGQPGPELPADTLVSAVHGARRGDVTHITIKGERVAAIVSMSTLAQSHLLAALLTSEVAASALPGVLPTAFPWTCSLPDDELQTFAAELREAVVAESPERVERVLEDWQAVAEVHAGTRTT
jgi:hypothetical protein